LVGIVIKDIIMKNIRLINLTDEDIKIEDLVSIRDTWVAGIYDLVALKEIYVDLEEEDLYYPGELIGGYADKGDITVLYYTPNKIYFDYYYK
jgi:hypothetical protein